MSTAKLSIASTLTSQLRDGILTGRLMPNTRLRLEELGTRYGVSLSPVREALLRLAGEGLVVSEDQRGFHVAEASIANLDEVARLRAHMEPFALRASIGCGDLAWEENLVSMFHRLTRIEQRDGFVPFLDEWERTHRDFHLALIAGCGMPMAIHFCATLHDQSDRYRRLFLKNRPPQRNVAKEHAAIMKAALDRDADTACGLLLAHSEQTAENVKAFMHENKLFQGD